MKAAADPARYMTKPLAWGLLLGLAWGLVAALRWL